MQLNALFNLLGKPASASQDGLQAGVATKPTKSRFSALFAATFALLSKRNSTTEAELTGTQSQQFPQGITSNRSTTDEKGIAGYGTNVAKQQYGLLDGIHRPEESLTITKDTAEEVVHSTSPSRGTGNSHRLNLPPIVNVNSVKETPTQPLGSHLISETTNASSQILDIPTKPTPETNTIQVTSSGDRTLPDTTDIPGIISIIGANSAQGSQRNISAPSLKNDGVGTDQRQPPTIGSHVLEGSTTSPSRELSSPIAESGFATSTAAGNMHQPANVGNNEIDPPGLTGTEPNVKHVQHLNLNPVSISPETPGFQTGKEMSLQPGTSARIENPSGPALPIEESLIGEPIGTPEAGPSDSRVTPEGGPKTSDTVITALGTKAFMPTAAPGNAGTSDAPNPGGRFIADSLLQATPVNTASETSTTLPHSPHGAHQEPIPILSNESTSPPPSLHGAHQEPIPTLGNVSLTDESSQVNILGTATERAKTVFPIGASENTHPSPGPQSHTLSPNPDAGNALSIKAEFEGTSDRPNPIMTKGIDEVSIQHTGTASRVETGTIPSALADKVSGTGITNIKVPASTIVESSLPPLPSGQKTTHISGHQFTNPDPAKTVALDTKGVAIDIPLAAVSEEITDTGTTISSPGNGNETFNPAEANVKSEAFTDILGKPQEVVHPQRSATLNTTAPTKASPASSRPFENQHTGASSISHGGDKPAVADTENPSTTAPTANAGQSKSGQASTQIGLVDSSPSGKSPVPTDTPPLSSTQIVDNGGQGKEGSTLTTTENNVNNVSSSLPPTGDTAQSHSAVEPKVATTQPEAVQNQAAPVGERSVSIETSTADAETTIKSTVTSAASNHQAGNIVAGTGELSSASGTPVDVEAVKSSLNATLKDTPSAPSGATAGEHQDVIKGSNNAIAPPAATEDTDTVASSARPSQPPKEDSQHSSNGTTYQRSTHETPQSNVPLTGGPGDHETANKNVETSGNDTLKQSAAVSKPTETTTPAIDSAQDTEARPEAPVKDIQLDSDPTPSTEHFTKEDTSSSVITAIKMAFKNAISSSSRHADVEPSHQSKSPSGNQSPTVANNDFTTRGEAVDPVVVESGTPEAKSSEAAPDFTSGKQQPSFQIGTKPLFVTPASTKVTGTPVPGPETDVPTATEKTFPRESSLSGSRADPSGVEEENLPIPSEVPHKDAPSGIRPTNTSKTRPDPQEKRQASSSVPRPEMAETKESEVAEKHRSSPLETRIEKGDASTAQAMNGKPDVNARATDKSPSTNKERPADQKDVASVGKSSQKNSSQGDDSFSNSDNTSSQSFVQSGQRVETPGIGRAMEEFSLEMETNVMTDPVARDPESSEQPQETEIAESETVIANHQTARSDNSSNATGSERTHRSRPMNPAWLRAMMSQHSRTFSTENGWKVLEMQLEEGSGTMTVKARRDEDRVAVSVGFSDPHLRSLALANAERLQQAIEAQYDADVEFSLFSDGTYNAEDQQDAPQNRTSGPFSSDNATPSDSVIEQERLIDAALQGANNVWFG